MFSCLKIQKQIKTTPGFETAAVWSRHHKSWLKMLPILLLASLGLASVHGHGGVVWPPIWQDGVGLGLDEVYSRRIQNNPVDHDWRTNKAIDNTRSWLTDQSYTGGTARTNRAKAPTPIQNLAIQTGHIRPLTRNGHG